MHHALAGFELAAGPSASSGPASLAAAQREPADSRSNSRRLIPPVAPGIRLPTLLCSLPSSSCLKGRSGRLAWLLVRLPVVVLADLGAIPGMQATC